jgi:hypothetical protein
MRNLILLGVGAILAVAAAWFFFWRPSNDPLGIVPVSGTVLVGDEPLTEGYVIFRPDPDKGNKSLHEPRGAIDKQGHYKLITGNDTPGAPQGWYKVGVVAQKTGTERHGPPVYLISKKYADPNASGITIEVVKEPAPSAYDLKVTR